MSAVLLRIRVAPEADFSAATAAISFLGVSLSLVFFLFSTPSLVRSQFAREEEGEEGDLDARSD